MTLSAIVLACASIAAAPGESPGLELPEGFVVFEFASSALANDIHTLALDSKGRVFVAGRGYVRILPDDDGDGRADRAIDFLDRPEDGSTGLFWHGPYLFLTGDGGLWRYVDADGDDKPDAAPIQVARVHTGNEHGAHAVARGPDGWLYLLCGNNSGSLARFASKSSPVRSPIAGGVVRFGPEVFEERFDPAALRSEVVADGFRNPFGMAFSADGELFTYDSDNERCVSLPWYEGTRVYHVTAGGRHGWQNPQRAETWRSPPYFVDVVPPVVDLGRGSPTGVVCYLHSQFPKRYQGGLFVGDWTFGRIFFVGGEADGSSDAGRPKVFARSIGASGFAPTGMAVHPTTGELYVAIGGRGTRGAVFRIRAKEGSARGPAAAFEPRRLDLLDGEESTLVRDARAGGLPERRRAIERILRAIERFTPGERLEIVRANLDARDGRIRGLVVELFRSLPASFRNRIDAPASVSGRVNLAWALAEENAEQAQRIAASAFADGAGRDRLDAVRVLQIAAGDVPGGESKSHVFAGYARRRPAPIDRNAMVCLLSSFPTGEGALDRELARLAAMLEWAEPSWRAKLTERWTDASDPVDDIHFLIVFARLSGERASAETRAVARSLLDLDRKLRAQGRQRDRNWALRIGELHAALAARDQDLDGAMLADPAFGRPDHVLFARTKGFDRRKAAAIFLKRGETERDYEWTPEVVDVLDVLPVEHAFPAIRRLWDEPALRESIVRGLARNPREEDRPRFVAAFASPSWSFLDLGLRSLERLPPRNDAADVAAAIDALARLPDVKEADALRERLVAHLVRATGVKSPGAGKDEWKAWFEEQYPDAPRPWSGRGAMAADWRSRRSAIEAIAGDPGRGAEVYRRLACAGCHTGARALGPDLAGVGKRFSTGDLLTAVVDPSRDVSPRYQTHVIAAQDGQVYQGLVVYEAVDSLILQTAADRTVRIPVDQVASRGLGTTSLMPTGLLDKSSDAEIADLFSYLRGLER